MASDVPLDYAVFQLSPRRSRCELFVSYDGITEKLASGDVKPFVTHLKVAEEKVALGVKSIKLEVERCKDDETWFTKGTIERFVLFVDTPEVLEAINTFDAETSQLETARRIYSQGAEDHQLCASGEDGAGAIADATKNELLRAIDVRLSAVRQDLTTACAHAFSAGFNPESVLELQQFADRFGARQLSEACCKFAELTHRRQNLFENNIETWKSSSDQTLRSSTSSSMSLNSPCADQPNSSTSKVTFPLRRFSRESSHGFMDRRVERENEEVKDKDKGLGPTTTSINTAIVDSDPSTQSSQTPQLTRRLSVQERISLFESKQKELPSSVTPSSSAGAKPEFRRLTSDVTLSSNKAVLRRWSGSSDISIDVTGDRKKEPDSNTNISTPTSSTSTLDVIPPKSKDQADFKGREKDKDMKESNFSKIPVRVKFGSGLEELAFSDTNLKHASFLERSSDSIAKKEQPLSGIGVQSREASFDGFGDLGLENQTDSIPTQFKPNPGKNEHLGSAYQMAPQKQSKNLSGGRIKPQQDTVKDFGAVIGHQGASESDLTRDQSAVPDSMFEPRWRSLGVEVKKVRRKDFESFEKQAVSSPMQIEDSGVSSSKFQVHGPKEEGDFGFSSCQLGSNNVLETEEAISSITVQPINQIQKKRQPKRNLELIADLKMKANDLENLFVEHKHHIPVDQSSSARRMKPAETPKELKGSNVNRKPVVVASPQVEIATGFGNMKFSSTPLVKTVDNQDYNVTPKSNVHGLSFGDDSKGKSYVKYMQKRDTKLREDWSSRRAEKQAKIKTMKERLEKSRSEMMTKLAASADKRSSVQNARRRAEKLRSFDSQSEMKREKPIDSFMNDEDEDQAGFLGKKLNEISLVDSSSRSAQSKKALPSKNTASTAPCNSARLNSGKASYSAFVRRRLNSDNPLAQSVPNFSDLRKENTKPSYAGSKQARHKGRSDSRKESSSKDLQLTSEEKSRRSQSLRKSTATAMELNDYGKSYHVDDEEYDKFSKHKESEPFPIWGSGFSKSKSSMMIEAVTNCYDGVSFETEEMTDVAKEGDEFETNIGGEFADSGSENTDAYGLSEFRTSMPSHFRAIQDSHVQSMFSFSHEISDSDASDSPLGSSASWNFHSLGQNEAEGPQMRKKWGVSQKPTVGTDSSYSYKDVSKGLERFLKFGMKNPASESLTDWISATTSEGEDDTEDGKDPAYRSSEDFIKSRMGFSHGHRSDDWFDESNLFNEQAPKSFFSLSNFRDIGSESKFKA